MIPPLLALGVSTAGCESGGPARPDAGVDAAVTDSGVDAAIDDAGTDAGLPDAGEDGGKDGGVNVTKIVDSSGGTVEASDGLTLTFPPGALDKATTIHIESTEASAAGVTRAGAAYLFEPSGLVFLTPITISIPFSPAQPGKLFLYWSKAGDDKSFEPITGTVSGNLYTASVTHFSKGFVGYPSKVKAFGSITSGGERLKTTNYRMDLYVAPAEPIGQANSPGHKIKLGPAALKTTGR
jgi:hypothetical protein